MLPSKNSVSKRPTHIRIWRHLVVYLISKTLFQALLASSFPHFVSVFFLDAQDVYENDPEESSADVRASLTREERRASRGGYAKQMQQQFLSDAEARQKNIRRTEIDIPREGKEIWRKSSRQGLD